MYSLSFPPLHPHQPLIFPCFFFLPFVKVRKNSNKTTDKTIKIRAYLYQPKAETLAPTPTPTEEPTTPAISITTGSQTKHNEVALTLSAAPTTEVSITTVNITDKDGKVKKPDGVRVDGTTVYVTYPYAESADASKPYTYEFTITGIGGSWKLTTGSYAVTAIDAADPQEVEIGSLQPVSFKLLAGTVDVTNAKSYLSDTVVTFAPVGTAQIVDSSTSPSKPQIWLAAADTSATMTVTYGKLDPKTVTINGVAPKATKAEGVFTNLELKAVVNEWWKTGNEGKDEFEYTKDSGEHEIFFFGKATDSSKALGYYAVAYDDVVLVSSSDENVATATISKAFTTDGNANKLYKINVKAKNIGNATITIKGKEIKGGVTCESEPYSFTVSVVDSNRVINKVTTNGPIEIYNANDEDYSATLKFKALNVNDELVDGYYRLTIKDSSGKEITGNEAGVINVNSTNGSLDAAEQSIVITAYGAEAGTYTIQITAWGEDGTDVNLVPQATVNVKVIDVYESILQSQVGDTSKRFDVNFADSSVSLGVNDDQSGDQSKDDIKLAATVGGKFIGYVRSSDGTKIDSIGNYTNSEYIPGQTPVAETKVADAKALFTRTSLAAQGAELSAYVTQNNVFYITDSNVFYLTKDYAVQKKDLGNFGDGSEVISGNAVDYDNAIKAGIAVNSNKTVQDKGKLATGKPVTWGVSILPSGKSLSDVYFFGNTSQKNEGIANAGTYYLDIYDHPLYGNSATDMTKKIGTDGKTEVTSTRLSRVTITVAYSVTMPDKIDYDISVSSMSKANSAYAVTPYDLFTNPGVSVDSFAGRYDYVTEANATVKTAGTLHYQNDYDTAKNLVRAWDATTVSTRFSTATWVTLFNDQNAFKKDTNVYAVAIQKWDADYITIAKDTGLNLVVEASRKIVK